MTFYRFQQWIPEGLALSELLLGFQGFALLIDGNHIMSNFKVFVLHEHEEKIAAYCAQNNIDFNQANAYDTVLETFKDEPIIYKTLERETGKEVEYIVTKQIARKVECQNTRSIFLLFSLEMPSVKT